MDRVGEVEHTMPVIQTRTNGCDGTVTFTKGTRVKLPLQPATNRNEPAFLCFQLDMTRSASGFETSGIAVA